MALVNGLETENLMDVVNQVEHNWETDKTVWQASTKWKGGFRVINTSPVGVTLTRPVAVSTSLEVI